ncbi:MAG: inositol monophosphatase, partial [Burkholderiales bacterium]|nr:inositol monophosphatase [Burkholderiales bacterium]
DVAAGSLIITEAGGLVGNFTGEADFLYQREIVAGSPKIYAQLVSLLAPHTRVIKGGGEAASHTESAATEAGDVVIGALMDAAPRERKPVRVRKPNGNDTPA